MAKRSAIVIGAGIVGLAMARALALRGYNVTVIERNGRSVGASIRNFGMIWPVGQPDGRLYERALHSRAIWKQISVEANIWHEEKGSLHLGYEQEEMKMLMELQEIYAHRNYRIMMPAEINAINDGIVTKGLLGGLYSPEEMVVDPRQAIFSLPGFLIEKYQVKFLWNTTINHIIHPHVYSAGQTYTADEIWICSGSDFETLYPEIYRNSPITKCKLQMLRTRAQPGGWRVGPSVCGGLSLLHYHSFRKAVSWNSRSELLNRKYPRHLESGIHVMISQNEKGEITIGDSHEYGSVHDPFTREDINELIVSYLARFIRLKDPVISERWNGFYAKLTDGSTEFVHEAAGGVTIVNGLGGAGMTLSFGLCEEIASGNYLRTGSIKQSAG